MMKKIVIRSKKEAIHLLAIVCFEMEIENATSKLYVLFKIYNDLGDDKESFVDLAKIPYTSFFIEVIMLFTSFLLSYFFSSAIVKETHFVNEVKPVLLLVRRRSYEQHSQTQ